MAELLDKTLIINVDGRNTEAMLEEGLPNMDAFLAVTGRSETNILAALLARRMGVKKVIARSRTSITSIWPRAWASIRSSTRS